ASMGPRIFVRGILREGIKLGAIGELQWGRGFLSAEFSKRNSGAGRSSTRFNGAADFCPRNSP
ncbi:MAG: hypothetical protein ACREQC_16355, partial [Candidatus Binataceae bacterium]